MCNDKSQRNEVSQSGTHTNDTRNLPTTFQSGPSIFPEPAGIDSMAISVRDKTVKRERGERESEVPLTLTQSGKGAHEGRSSSVGFVNPAAEFTFIVLRGSFIN